MMTTTESKRAKGSSEFAEHAKAAGKAALRQWKSLLPDDFWHYRREARRETVLALRSAVNTIIDRLEPTPTEAPPKPRSTRKAKVEVE
jgi:hypothetical protein